MFTSSVVKRATTLTVGPIRLATRTFATGPATDPLDLMRRECSQRNLCNDLGFRKPGVHWTISIAVGSDDPMQPPSLRTVGLQRLADNGMDFVVKRGTAASKIFATGRPLSILHLQGRYVAGEMAVQWRGEGHCETLPLHDLMDAIPDYTIVSMVASKRMQQEKAIDDSTDRVVVDDRSHATEVVQQVTQELKSGKVTEAELHESIRAYRFHPDRIERMEGGPDSIVLDRWEWKRQESVACPEGTISWGEAVNLMSN